ncbi:type II toxin-antitoxin system RelE family toxin [Streptomyces griseorubiginosus]|uniref:type II toxin-antitoxin system RelE family toxin n=1 Tax=Streptomyces griseorubiginosus TaxID=67304 RepID=UPI001AD7365E|nr:type II toxin-antitoxin system RelE/ParE family toxin [Streptomyces griseorubiginosus]MBO4258036.1 type II toxin-antitoxin system RelE/ParE family toxin [Streptomyces griseorubiginosus]
MAYEIVWEPRATNAAARFLKEDRAGLAAVYEAVDALADQPRPPGSIPYGSPDLRRLHVGDYRVLYVIDDDVIHILVTHLGRTA